MTQEAELVREIQRAITELPAADRAAVEAIIMILRHLLQRDAAHTPLAIALVGAELAATTHQTAGNGW